ncbi:HDOD domain-containing protein [Pseudoflavonifractor sp. 524-17]|uniref:EAL and HDOD domain-containing protein n=1 Tax=Pseudoflavonifractor sp. 524-17 TaxID=2304577 RepID=UPI00137A7DDC|nr:HDOD domain-containing protein [Pseudoflavonifractor sp. 524-17]NCE65525.1 HDOD domain-containing protein [Pseudoflavonifractor sp. 524-17]
MSSKYIVRQPIKDVTGHIIGHEILYHGENQAFSGEKGTSSTEFAAADTIYNFLTQNSTKVLRGSLSFMTFTTMLLMKKTPKLFDKNELVIQIDDSVIIHPLSMRFVQQFAQEGYKVAVNEFQFAPRYLALMDSIDYIKINIQTCTDVNMRNIIEIAHSMNKKCIVTNIDSAELHQKAIAMKADAVEGPYVAEKLTTKAHSGSYLQSNFFRLMVAVTRDEPNVDEIEQLIAADASLTYGLLKMANSVYFALRHRASTIHQAVMTLGLGQLKQWVYLLSASNAENQTDTESEEFLKLSFMRANFCSELMNYAKDMPISKAEAYLMGMFSTLNYLIDASMEEIVAEVPVVDEIKNALLRREGRCGKLYELVLCYEAADWERITTLADELGIPSNLITSVYFICMENVNMLWEQLTNPYPNQLKEAEEDAQPVS